MTLRWSDLSASVRARVRGGTLPDGRVTAGRGGGRGAGRARGGAAAQRAGARLEAAILLGAKTSPVVALEGLPKCGARFTGKGEAHALAICCDFVGAVVGTGRAVYFDAKRVGEEVAGLRCGDPKIVKAHQQAFLRRMAGAGAIAGVLVACERGRGSGPEYLWLDGRHLLGKVAGTIAWEDDRWHGLGAIEGGGGRIDFGKLVAIYEGGNR